MTKQAEVTPPDKCAFCGQVRSEKWAVLYGPPKLFAPPASDKEWSPKSHVCPACYETVFPVMHAFNKKVFTVEALQSK